MAMNARITNILESSPFLCSPIMSGLLPTRAIKNSSGTAATPLNTAAKTSALIGLIPIKFMPSPARVARIIKK